MGLTKLAIQRPVFILMLMCAAILMGAIGYNSMRKELNPDVSFGVVSITTVYPGAGPEEVNTLISRRMEEAVSGISNLREVVATSQEGVSSVVLNFEVGTNMDVATADVRTKVDQILGQIPRDAEKPVISKIDVASSPVVTLAVSSDKMSSRALRDLVDNVLKDKFARIKGVAQVGVNGGDIREIQIQIKKDALLRYKLGITDVQRAIANGTLNLPSGRIVSGSRETTVRMMGEFKTVKDIEDFFLTVSNSNQGGDSVKVRLGDIATVVDANAERRSLSRLDGRDSISIVIQKTRDGNAIEISDAILKSQFGAPPLLEQLQEQFGIKFTVTQDTSTNIRDSLDDLLFAILFGIFLVGTVVWTFLHNLRGTIIVAIAIPVCMFAALVAMWAAGFTVNNLSMLALSLAVGVLVDDAIVVLENIYRHLTLGEDPVDAAINGRSEIGLAAIAITMADVVVFVPIGTMGGIVGQFFRPLGLGYAVTVMLSLFVSFTVTPMLASRWYKKGEDWEHPKGRFARAFENMFHAFANGYRRVLRSSLKHRWYMFGGGFVVLVALFMFIGGSFAPDVQSAAQSAIGMVVISGIIAAAIFLGNLVIRRKFLPGVFLGFLGFSAVFVAGPVLGKMYHEWKKEDVFKFTFAPPSDSGSVQINIELPPGSSLAATSAVVHRVEEAVLKNPEAKFVVANVGTQGGGFSASSSGTQYAQVIVTLYDKESAMDRLMFWKKHEEKLRTVKDTDVAAQITQEVGRVPGAKINIAAGQSFSFGSAIQLALRSDDRAKLLATATKIRDELASGAIEGVVGPNISSKGGKPELQAIPHRGRMADANVSAADLGAAMRTMYEGDTNTKFRVNGEEYDIRVMMDLQDRDNPAIVADMPIVFKQGTPVFLSELADLEQGHAIDKIDRRDRQEVIMVTADLLPGYASGSVQAKINQWLTDKHLVPEGVTSKALGQADAQARETPYLLGAMGIGLVLVYMVLASLFDNLLYPAIIQLAQPQAMVGALLALILTDKTLNIVGMIGIIALIGLVGKNAILIVDYTNTLRERGMEKYEALVESGGTRLRPIMMTTLALVFGMLPVALAIGRGSEFRETIGITIIGGTLLSTVLSLLVIPCSYSIFDDAYIGFGKAVAWARARFRRG